MLEVTSLWEVFEHRLTAVIQLLVPSPRNAPWMTVSLLRSTACTKFFYTLQLTNNLTGLWREKNDLKFFAVDTVDSMLKGTPEHFPYKVSYARAQWDPILVLHSSGSTGKQRRIHYPDQV